MRRGSAEQRLVFGAVLAFLGVVFLLDNFHVFDARAVLSFWPVALIAIGGIKLMQSSQPGGQLVGGILASIGVVWTLSNMGLIGLRWRDWWPLLLIAAGGLVIYRGQSRHQEHTNADGSTSETLHDNRMDLTAIMSGNQVKVDTQDFRGGDVTAIMAGVEMDFRGASIQGDATLNVLIAMGGLDMKVPPDWSVTVKGIPLLGGIEDKSVPPPNPQKRLIITGVLIMGGIQIKN